MGKYTNMSGDWIKDLIRDFIAASPLNTMQNEAGDPAWDDCAGGIRLRCRSDLAAVQGVYRRLSLDALGSLQPALSRETRRTDGADRHFVDFAAAGDGPRGEPPDQNLSSRGVGQDQGVRRSVQRGLASPCGQEPGRAGHAAVAPMLVSNWTIVKSQRFSYASSWSERHAAHAAGLGTFGLCDGLITARGKAMRAGSVVAKISIEPTPRPYADHRAYCLFFADGTCGKCIDRCPARAITEAGHDKEKCRQHLARSREYVERDLQVRGLWLRVVPGGRTLRGRHTGQGRPRGPGARRIAAAAAAFGLRKNTRCGEPDSIDITIARTVLPHFPRRSHGFAPPAVRIFSFHPRTVWA